MVRLDEPVDTHDVPRGDDLLAQLAIAAEDETIPPGTELLNIVRDPATALVSAPVLIDVAKDLIEEGKESQAHLEPLRKIERALQALRSVRIGNETRRLDAVAERLAELITEADRIAAEIGDHTSPGA